jgi:hypothetical protein
VIDLYCERVGSGLWSEPLNAITNLAFVAAGLAMVRHIERWNHGNDRGAVALIVLMVAIGIGSGLFHTYANSAAQLADVLPILLFQLVFLGLYLRRNLGIAHGATITMVAVFLVLCLVARGWPQLLNGSLAYAPAWTALVLLGIHQGRRGHGPVLLLWAAGLFFLSLTFRSLDLALCASFPHGTHFLWHILNSLVLVLCTLSVLPAQGRYHRYGRLR